MISVEILKNSLSEYLAGFPMAIVHLFGSKARGDDGPYSDFDLGILFGLDG